MLAYKLCIIIGIVMWDGCLLGCSAMYSGKSLPTFQSTLLLLSLVIIARMIEVLGPLTLW